METVKSQKDENNKPTILRFGNAFVGLMLAAQLAFSIILMSKNMKAVELGDVNFVMQNLFYYEYNTDYVKTVDGCFDIPGLPTDVSIDKNHLLTLITVSCSIFSFVGILTILVQIYNPFCKGKDEIHEHLRQTHFLILLAIQVFMIVLQLGFVVFFSKDFKDKFGKNLNIGFGCFGISVGICIVLLLLVSAHYQHSFVFCMKSVIGFTSILQILWICCAIVVIVQTKFKWEAIEGFMVFIYTNLLPAVLMFLDPRMPWDDNRDPVTYALFAAFIVLFLIVSVLGFMLSCCFKPTRGYEIIAIIYACLTIIIALSFFTGIAINVHNDIYSNANVQFPIDEKDKHYDDYDLMEMCFRIYRKDTFINKNATDYKYYPRLEIYRYGYGCSIFYFAEYAIVIAIAIVLAVRIALGLVDVPPQPEVLYTANDDNIVRTVRNEPPPRNDDNNNNGDDWNRDDLNHRWRMDVEAGKGPTLDGGKYVLPPLTQKDLFVF